MNNDNKNTVLVVDDTPTNLQILLDTLESSGFKVLVATEGDEALERATVTQPDLVLMDVMMPGMDGFETCQRMKQNPTLSDIPVIFMTALSDIGDKVRAFDAGGVDYITKPFQEGEVLARIDTHLTIRRLHQELKQQNELLQQEIEAHQRAEATASYLRDEIKIEHNFEEIVGNSTSLKTCLQQVSQVAKTNTTVLILGETGTGKELIARALHHHSPRQEQPLIKVNCAALPKELLESELFGHEKGAFTGALQRRQGRFELADGGTIFLDEIGELPPAAQAGLLRVLQEQEFERVGGSQTIRVDVRVLAATHRDLKKMVFENDFREDLYYRLNVFPLEIPPLRERHEDIVPLIEFFVSRFSTKLGIAVNEITNDALQQLQDYHWPGNIRELENIIERAMILSNQGRLELPPGTLISTSPATAESTVPAQTVADESIDDDTNDEPDVGTEVEIEPAEAVTLDEIQRQHILKILEQTRWRISGKQGAAELLGLQPTTLRHRMSKLGIHKTISD